jgi:hypothetical protein
MLPVQNAAERRWIVKHLQPRLIAVAIPFLAVAIARKPVSTTRSKKFYQIVEFS